MSCYWLEDPQQQGAHPLFRWMGQLSDVRQNSAQDLSSPLDSGTRSLDLLLPEPDPSVVHWADPSPPSF